MSGEREVAEDIQTLRSMFPDETEEQLSRALDVAGSVAAAIQRLLDGPVEIDQDQARKLYVNWYLNCTRAGFTA